MHDPTERLTIGAASPALATFPVPEAVTLGTTPVTLKDTAVLAGGYHPTGTIIFTLSFNGGTPVDTETVQVNDNRAWFKPG